MASRMFDNYPQPDGYTPTNIPSELVEYSNIYGSIIQGATARHNFEVPFDPSDVRDLTIIYKQGLSVVLTKSLSDVEFFDEDPDNHSSILWLNLSTDETSKFQLTNQNNLVQVQIKIELNSTTSTGEYNVSATPIMLMEVLPILKDDMEAYGRIYEKRI